METSFFKEIIEVIEAEQQRRIALLKAEDADFAYDQWSFRDEPLLNEFCLMLLLTLRHQIERELVNCAALAMGGGETITHQEYEGYVQALRQTNKRGDSIGWKWDKIKASLNLRSHQHRVEAQAIEALRLLANSYKHDPSAKPADDLKRLLKLPDVPYAPLPESDLFRQKLAAFIGLSEDTPYPDIAERFVALASKYLQHIKDHTKMSKLKPRPVSPRPSTFEH